MEKLSLKNKKCPHNDCYFLLLSQKIILNRYKDLLLRQSSYYKVVVFIDPLQGLYAILLEILWIVFTLLPLDGF